MRYGLHDARYGFGVAGYELPTSGCAFYRGYFQPKKLMNRQTLNFDSIIKTKIVHITFFEVMVPLKFLKTLS